MVHPGFAYYPYQEADEYDEEQFEGLRCIAMPVFCHTGEVAGSMCVVGPRHRLTHQKLAAVRAPLAALARELSARLGHVEAAAA